MTPADIADVLTAAALYDGRTVGVTDVAAWHAIIGPYDREDGLAAVVRHYGESTEWMKPAHLKRHILDIRNERAASKAHEIRALPSRFEADEIRDERIADNVRRLAEAWSVPAAEKTGDIHAVALARAKRERKGRQIPQPRLRRDSKPIDLAKVTTGPEWASAEAREREAVAHLHRAERHCGRAVCTTCNHVKAQR